MGEQKTSDEPLSSIAADEPVACALCAKKKGLLNQPGLKQFKRTSKHHSKHFREANEAKIRQCFSEPKCKCGIEVLRNYDHAVCLDEANGNTLWQDVIKLEMELMKTIKAFKDNGKDAPTPNGHKNIRVHLVFDMKHDECHHA